MSVRALALAVLLACEAPPCPLGRTLTEADVPCLCGELRLPDVFDCEVARCDAAESEVCCNEGCATDSG